MKKITFVLFTLTSIMGFSQNTVTVDVGETWNGFMNVFDNPADPAPACAGNGGYCFGSGWGLAELVAVVGAMDVTLSPNVNTYADNPGDAYWRDNNGAGPDGNKIMEANFFVEPGASFNNVDLTFTGEVTTNSLDARYTAVVFIKTIGGTNLNKTIPVPASGVFSLSATAAELATGTVQYGFSITGLNANPADNWGNIVVAPVALSTTDFDIANVKIHPNPSNDLWNIQSSIQNISSIGVYDIFGKRVLNLIPNAQNVSIDASGLSTGMYFAKIITPDGSKSVKLIKN